MRLINLAIVLGLVTPLGVIASPPAYAVSRGYTVNVAYTQSAYLYQASSITAAVAARYDKKVRDQMAEIDKRNTTIAGLRAQLRNSRISATSLQTQIDQLEAENAKLMADFTAALAAKDDDFARLLDSLTRVGDRLAQTAEGREALAAYVAGDPGSYAKTKIVLREILEAEEQLRQSKAAAQAKQDALTRAAQRREFAAFTLNARDQGTEATVEVIAAYRQVVAVDPSNHWDWIELARLYLDANLLEEGLIAAGQALSTSKNDRDRSFAFDEIGGLKLRALDYDGALESFQNACSIQRILLEGDEDDFDKTANYAEESDYAACCLNMGDVFAKQRNLDGAMRRYIAALKIRRRLLNSRPNDTEMLRLIATTQGRIGTLYLKNGYVNEAHDPLKESLEISIAQSNSEPDSIFFARELAAARLPYGLVLEKRGLKIEAQAQYEDALKFNQRRAKMDPLSSEAQSDLLASLIRLAGMHAKGHSWKAAADQIDVMEARGILQSGDKQVVGVVRSNAALEKSPRK